MMKEYDCLVWFGSNERENTSKITKMHKKSKRKQKLKFRKGKKNRMKKKVGKIENYKTQTAIILEHVMEFDCEF